MDVYVLIGEGKSGKSSVTRCLTGSSSSGTRLIATQTGPLRVYIYLISLQEDKEKITPEDFERMVNQEDCDAVLVSLRLRSVGRCPDADTYLTHFINIGWHIVRVACLDVPASSISTPLPNDAIRTFPRITEITPVNQLAAKVRRYFRWV